MPTVIKFEELEIWQLARSLYANISLISKKLKELREFRFSEQMRASSGSIMDNIAEGFERCSRLEFLHSLSISKGETGELKSQLYRCLDDKVITQMEFENTFHQTDLLSKKIASFISYLNNSHLRGLKYKDRL
jgi:four helix bundle protein